MLMNTVALTRLFSQVPLRKGGERGLFPSSPLERGPRGVFRSKSPCLRLRSPVHAWEAGKRQKQPPFSPFSKGDLRVNSSMPQGLLFLYRNFSHATNIPI